MIILVRHGQTSANAAGLIQGQSDHDLSELGRRQARALAGRSLLTGAAACVSSPLRRARQTAEALWGDRPVVVDDRWKEMDYGELEGRPVAEVRAFVRPRWLADVGWAPAGGESLVAVYERVVAACHDLASAHQEGDVVVVTHVSPIKVAVAWALGVGPEIAARMNVDLASVTLIDARAGQEPTLLAYNLLS